MKNRLILALAGALLFLAGSASAQLWNQQTKIYVPFEFVVGETVLPAGTYSVMVQAAHNPAQLMFKNKQTGASVVVNNTDIGMPFHTYVENSSLVFELDNSGRHVLHQIWLAGDTHGHDLMHPEGIPEPK